MITIDELKKAEMQELKEANETKKASAITKLKALGLDDDEINAIIGA